MLNQYTGDTSTSSLAASVASSSRRMSPSGIGQVPRSCRWSERLEVQAVQVHPGGLRVGQQRGGGAARQRPVIADGARLAALPIRKQGARQGIMGFQVWRLPRRPATLTMTR